MPGGVRTDRACAQGRRGAPARQGRQRRRQGGGGAVKENVGNTGVRHERNGRETPRPPARDFYKRAARKKGGALPRGRKLCYNKLL